MKTMKTFPASLGALAWALALSAGCPSGHGHSHGDQAHGEPEHGHPHGEPAGEPGHAHEQAGHDDGHGHGHEGPAEVVTLWGATTQLFVEFPALVVGQESPFAAHLTRLGDHFAVDRGSVVVELSGGGHPVERFEVDAPSVAGIFRPVVRPAHPGPRQLTLRLASTAASEVHAMGVFTVFGARSEAEEAAQGGDEDGGGISYLLEQQWKIPFRVERVAARHMRPTLPAFARLVLPPQAAAVVSAPRDGRVEPAGGRLPFVGEEVASNAVLFDLVSAPTEGGDPATLDLAVDRAAVRVSAARREVERLEPLAEQGIVPRRRMDEARTELAAARTELQGARRKKSSLDESQRVGGRGERIAVPSPIAGSVVELFVAPGAWVTTGQRLARVVDRDVLWLDVGLPEAYVGRLGQVSGAWFQLEGVRGVFDVPRAALVSVGAEVEPDTRTLPVRFRIDNVRRELFAGMTTEAHLVTDAPIVTTTVPAAAVVDDGGADVVYVQTGGETFARRPVQLGIRDGGYVEVRAGVLPGEWVATRGAYAIKLASTSKDAIGHGHAH